MSVKFNIQIEIPDSLLSKMSTYSFIPLKDWMKYGNTNTQLPAKYADFINKILQRKIKSLSPNMSLEILEELPVYTRRMIISELGYDLRSMKGLSIVEVINKIEQEKKATLIVMEYQESYKAMLIEKSPN